MKAGPLEGCAPGVGRFKSTKVLVGTVLHFSCNEGKWCDLTFEFTLEQ